MLSLSLLQAQISVQVNALNSANILIPYEYSRYKVLIMNSVSALYLAIGPVLYDRFYIQYAGT